MHSADAFSRDPSPVAGCRVGGHRIPGKAAVLTPGGEGRAHVGVGGVHEDAVSPEHVTRVLGEFQGGGVDEQGPCGHFLHVEDGADLAGNLVFDIDALVDQQVDGVIAVSPLVSQARLENVPQRTPVVLFGRHERSDNYDSVAGDDEKGARDALNHLFDLGHDRVLHLTRDGLATSPTRHTPHGSRLETYLRVTEETGRSEFTRVIRSEEGESYANDVIRHLLQTEEHPTAIFAGHDELAIGALHAIQVLGVDISIVGYDNVPIASHPALSLTSVDQQGERMGARAVELLLERISGRTDAVHERFTTTLQERRSSRRPSTG